MIKNLLFTLFLLGSIFSAATPCYSQNDAILLKRKPYLQCALSDSITILWRTNIGKESKVAYRPASTEKWQYQNGITRSTNTGLVENEVVLKKLKPFTSYEYQIFTDEKQLLQNDALYFKPNVASSDTTFSFFAVGDIGEPVDQQGTPDVLAKALSKYNDSVSFGLLLGDIIYPDGKSEDYDINLFDHFGSVFPYVPVFTILGNHDWHNPQENYMKEWKLPGNEHYYSFNKGNAHFTALDTKNGEMHDYKEQIKWLEQDLSSIPDEITWRIVFLHHNGKSCTYKEDYKAVMSLYPLFEKYKIDLVLNGHAHTYERLKPMDGRGQINSTNNNTAYYDSPDGFISITVGSGGKLRGIGSDPKPFTPDPDNCRHPGLVAKSAHDWAFLYLTIEGKTLKAQALATNDFEVLDSFVIEK